MVTLERYKAAMARIAELEAERDQLTGKSQLAHEIAAGAMENAKRLLAENALLRKALEDLLSDCDTDEWRLAVVNAKAALARNTKEK